MTTFRKLHSGDWGVQTDLGVIEGMTLTVTKKDGSTVPVKVQNMVWSGQQDGRQITLCAIERKEGSQHSQHPRQSQPKIQYDQLHNQRPTGFGRRCCS